MLMLCFITRHKASWSYFPWAKCHFFVGTDMNNTWHYSVRELSLCAMLRIMSLTDAEWLKAGALEPDYSWDTALVTSSLCASASTLVKCNHKVIEMKFFQ
jgi:hypothetical protein